MIKRGKKGQITIFIIIGIVILFAVGLFLYLRTITPAGPGLPGQPVKLHPVQQFVVNCIEQTGEDAIRRAGLTGGFVEYPPEVQLNPRLSLATGHPNTKIPYWYVDGTNRVPDSNYISSQISKYVLNNLDSCLNNFENFKNQFDISIEGKPTATTSMPASGVMINMRYPILLTSKVEPKESFEFRDFTATIPIRLNQSYELARELLERENAQGFLEQLTMDLINLDEAVPDIGIDVSCTPKTWAISDIKPAVQELVQTNLPFVRLEGTNFFPISKDLPYTATHFVWNYSEKKFPDMKASFTYDQRWPMTLFASPSSNGIVRSDPLQGADILKLLCLQTWNVAYDIIYPVKVTIVDEEVEGHKDFVFNYAFMVSINKNRPDRSTFAIQSTSPEEIPLSEEFCAAATKDMTIYTLNNVTGEDVVGVNVSYTCGRFRCEMGQSDWLGGIAAGIQRKFPACANGFLKGVGENFDESISFVSTNVPKAATLYMTPTKIIDDYIVFKHRQTLEGVPLSLAPDETVTISMKRPGSSKEIFGFFPSDTQSPLTLLADDDFTYELTMYLLRRDQVVGGWQGNWTASWNDLSAGDKITFHVLEQYPDPADDTQRITFLSNLTDLSKMVPAPEIG